MRKTMLQVQLAHLAWMCEAQCQKKEILEQENTPLTWSPDNQPTSRETQATAEAVSIVKIIENMITHFVVLLCSTCPAPTERETHHDVLSHAVW